MASASWRPGSLVDQGHEVVLHGRNEGRSREALAAAAGARGVVSGDLSTIAGARTLADEVNKLGRFDAVIHNAGTGYRERRVEMEPGVPSVFAVNVHAGAQINQSLRSFRSAPSEFRARAQARRPPDCGVMDEAVAVRSNAEHE